ncbi:MAG: hypothetical protein AABY15_01090 [Nanoarchaeota archaeon]
MISGQPAFKAKIPLGKALIYQRFHFRLGRDFVVEIGERVKGIEKITSTFISIPNPSNKDEYWQKVNRIKNLHRINDTLKEYKVSPIFDAGEYYPLSENGISNLSDEDILYLKSIS